MARANGPPSANTIRMLERDLQRFSITYFQYLRSCHGTLQRLLFNAVIVAWPAHKKFPPQHHRHNSVRNVDDHDPQHISSVCFVQKLVSAVQFKWWIGVVDKVHQQAPTTHPKYTTQEYVIADA